MRVLLCTLVLLLGVFGVSSQSTGATLTGATFRVTAGDAGKGYTFTDANGTYYNPTISVTPGTNVTISLEYSTNHPFGLSFNGSTLAVEITPGFFPPPISALVTATGSCDTTAGAAAGITVWLPNKTANANATCVLTVNVPPAEEGIPPVFYRCIYHPLMVGAIAVAANPTTAAPTNGPTTAAPTNGPTTAAPTNGPTTAAPTNGPTTAAPTNGPTTAAPTNGPTTAAPTNGPTGPIVGGTISGQYFRITGGNATTGYIFTDTNNQQYLNPTINVTTGYLSFSLEYSGTHPFGLSPSAANPPAPTTVFFPDNFNKDSVQSGSCDGSLGTGSPAPSIWNPKNGGICTLVITIGASVAGQSGYYRCAYHGAMIGKLNVAAAPTPLTGQTLSGNSFRITGANATTGYIFTANGGQLYLNPTLSVNPGTNVTFSLEYSGVHPFGLSNNPANPPAATTAFFPDSYNKPNYPTGACDGSFGQGSPAPSIWNPKTGGICTLTITIPANAAGQTAGYRCAIHAPMVGLVTVSGSGRSNTASSTTGAGAGLALVVALVAALMA